MSRHARSAGRAERMTQRERAQERLTFPMLPRRPQVSRTISLSLFIGCSMLSAVTGAQTATPVPSFEDPRIHAVVAA